MALRSTLRRVHATYEGEASRPLGGYVSAMLVYTTLVGTAAAAGRASGVRPPERWGVGDTTLLAVATHKASRLLAKDAVTSPLRAPFTRFESDAGNGEVNESVRGRGARHTVGEVITCPLCLSMWVATGLAAGLVFAPRATRLVSTVLASVAVSDVLQIAYDGSKQLLQRAAGESNDE